MSAPNLESEHFRTSPKKRGRGKSQKSLDLIEAAYNIAERLQPISVRGLAYKLFTAGVIPSMETKHTKRVSEQITDAREQGVIPWAWIVDEKREIEGVSTWADAGQYVRSVRNQYRRDFWAHQQERVLLVSEKGTVRGVVRPVTDEYGVDFLSLSGFGGAGIVHQIAQEYTNQPLTVLYIGDFDPSGMNMSEVDLPGRIERYGGDRVTVERIALVWDDLGALPGFPAATKTKDSRYKWFVKNYGPRCWELDAMDENDLRRRVETAIRDFIEPVAWARCEAAQEAEQQSLEALLDNWRAA